MKVTIEVECTPVEARSFMGLPDVTSLNDHLMEEMKSRMSANMSALEPETLMKSWMNFGGEAGEQMRKMMFSAMSTKSRS